MSQTERPIPSAADAVEASLRIDDLRSGESRVIPVVEERASVGVERLGRGGVRVRVVTEPVEEVHDLALSSQTVEVTRHPIGHEIDTIPAPREEGDLLIVPVVEERAVVVTKLFLTEEIHIRRINSTSSVEVPVNLRRQHAVVERLEPGQDPADQDLTDPDPARPLA